MKELYKVTWQPKPSGFWCLRVRSNSASCHVTSNHPTCTPSTSKFPMPLLTHHETERAPCLWTCHSSAWNNWMTLSSPSGKPHGPFTIQTISHVPTGKHLNRYLLAFEAQGIHGDWKLIQPLILVEFTANLCKTVQPLSLLSFCSHQLVCMYMHEYGIVHLCMYICSYIRIYMCECSHIYNMGKGTSKSSWKM